MLISLNSVVKNLICFMLAISHTHPQDIALEREKERGRQVGSAPPFLRSIHRLAQPDPCISARNAVQLALNLLLLCLLPSVIHDSLGEETRCWMRGRGFGANTDEITA